MDRTSCVNPKDNSHSQSGERTNVDRTCMDGTGTDVEMETQASENDACVEVARTGGANSEILKSSTELGKVGLSPPVVIKTEPIDPDEYVPTNLGMTSEITVDSQDNSSMDKDPASDVTIEERTNPSNDLVEDTGVQDEIAQLLQVCQEVQESMTDVETELATQDAAVSAETQPATQDATTSRTENSALNILSVKSPNGRTISGGSESSALQNKTLKGKKATGKTKHGNKKTDKLPKTYSEMSEDYGLVYNDVDMVSTSCFASFSIDHSYNWRIHGKECVKITIPLH